MTTYKTVGELREFLATLPADLLVVVTDVNSFAPVCAARLSKVAQQRSGRYQFGQPGETTEEVLLLANEFEAQL